MILFRRLTALFLFLSFLQACRDSGQEISQASSKPSEKTADQTQAAGSPGTAFVRTILRLKPDGSATVSTETATRSQQAAEFQARTAHDPSVADCSAGLWLFDDPNPAAGNQLCVLGTGSVSLQKVNRPDGGTWAGVAKVIWPGDASGFLSASACLNVECPSQNFKKGADRQDADASGQSADQVTLYALKDFPSTWENVHRFAVVDGFQDVSARAPLLDFIWSGDVKTADLNAANPRLVVGHYMPMNAMDDGQFSHCNVTADCVQPGYTCAVSPPSTYRPLKYYEGEKVCLLDKPAQQKTCNQASDCAGGDGNCFTDHLCYVSAKQQKAASLVYWKGKRPDQILYGAGGQDPAWWGDAIQPPFDFTNREVAEELLSRIRRWRGDGYAALSLDVVFPANYYGVAGTYQAGGWTPIFGGAQGYDPAHCSGGFCDAAWTDAVLKWLKRLRDEMHKDGLSLVINIGYTGSVPPYFAILAEDPVLKQIFEIVDGVFDEGGFSGAGQRQTSGNPCAAFLYDGAYNCPPGYVGNFNAWTNYAHYVQAVQSLGKPYFIKSAFLTANYQTPPTAPQIEWALASYLLVKERSAYLYVTPVSDDGSTPVYPQLDVAIGHACEPMQEIAGTKTRTRTYSHGFVIVNAAAQGTPSQTVALPEGHDFLKWNGTNYSVSVASPVKAGHQTGQVLYTPDALCY